MFDDFGKVIWEFFEVVIDNDSVNYFRFGRGVFFITAVYAHFVGCVGEISRMTDVYILSGGYVGTVRIKLTQNTLRLLLTSLERHTLVSSE